MSSAEELSFEEKKELLKGFAIAEFLWDLYEKDEIFSTRWLVFGVKNIEESLARITRKIPFATFDVSFLWKTCTLLEDFVKIQNKFKGRLIETPKRWWDRGDSEEEFDIDAFVQGCVEDFKQNHLDKCLIPEVRYERVDDPENDEKQLLFAVSFIRRFFEIMLLALKKIREFTVIDLRSQDLMWKWGKGIDAEIKAFNQRFTYGMGVLEEAIEKMPKV